MTKHLQLILLYPNARLIFEGIPYILRIIQFPNETLVLDNPVTGRQKIVHQTNVKLSLRSLSSITEDEKRELAEILCGELTPPDKLTVYDDWFHGVWIGSGDMSWDFHELPYKAADQLRDWNYCIDSWAVDEKIVVLQD